MKAGIQHHRLGFEIAQQYHQHVTLAPMTEAFSDRQFLIVQREKEALVGGGESGGPYNSSCSASDKIWTRSSNAMDLAQKTKSYSNRAQIGSRKSNTLWRPQTAGPPEHFVVLDGKSLEPSVGRNDPDRWPLKLGKVQVSVLVRSLLKSERPSGLTQAIIEVGRINKTLYLLNYIDDEDYRRRILTQLNRGESRHAVARAICHGQKVR